MGRDKVERMISGSLRSCIHSHGPITHEWIGSATKRIYSQLKADYHLVPKDGPSPTLQADAKIKDLMECLDEADQEIKDWKDRSAKWEGLYYQTVREKDGA